MHRRLRPDPRCRLARALSALAGLCVLALPAAAHDTWFEPRGAPVAGRQALLLGTGDRFPALETGVAERYLEQRGCRDAAGQALELKARRNLPNALLLETAAAATDCWMQLQPFEIEIEPAKVARYLDEIRAAPALRQAWARIRERGLPWRERYTKHARIALGSGGAGAVGLHVDVLLERAGEGGALAFTVLKAGRPLAGLPVELRSATLPVGFWHQTDAQGRVSVPALPAGRWLLRGTELRLVQQPADTWESDFLSFAFEVPARR